MSRMKKRILALLLVAVMFVLSACSSGGNDVSRAYNDAMNAMKQGKYAEAADKLSGISYYEDSVQLAQYCRAHAKAAEGLYGEAVDLLRKLDGYRDSSRCVDYFRAREAEDLASTPSERAYAASLYADDSISGFRDSPVRAETIRSALYQEGLKAEEAGDWKTAADVFGALNDYKESVVKYCYASGRVYEAEGAGDAMKYVSAAKFFHNARNYLDGEERKQNCISAALEKADQLIKTEEFDKAEKIYIGLGDFCDESRLKALEEAREKAAEAARQKKIAEADALLEEGRYDEAIALYLECGEEQKAEAADLRKTEELYLVAVEASEKGDYERSIDLYSRLKGKKDCTLRMTNDLYLYGRQLMENGKPGDAAAVFGKLQGVGSADLYEKMARYAAAEALEGKGSYRAAASAFEMLEDYSDARDRAEKCRYLLAGKLKAGGEYEEAAEIFTALGGRENSAEEAKDCRYLLAQQYEEKKDWEKAIELYKALKDYSESAARCAECYRLLGRKQLEAGQAEDAYQSFSAAGDAEGKAEAAFAAGEIRTSGMELKDALTWYERAAGYPQTEERTAMIAQSLLNIEEDELSEKYASVCENSEKAQAVLYALALRSLERKDEEAAMRQMKKAGDNADATERFQAMLTARVEALVAEEKYDDAVFLCSNYGDQERAEEIRNLKAQKEEEARLKAEEEEKKAEEEKRKAEEAEKQRNQARIDEAGELLEAGKFDEAIDIYRELNEQEMVEEAVYRKAAALNQPGLYMDILDYKDSRELHYQAGKALLESDPDKAFAILTEDISYSDIPAVLYDLAEQESKKDNCRLSSLIFGRLAALPLDPENPKADCRMRALQDMYRYGLQLKANGEWETAAGTFDLIAGLGQAQAHSNEAYYEIAAAMEENGRYVQAAVAFEALGEFNNSSERAKQNRYYEAKRQLEAGSFDEAEAGFRALGKFGDAPQMVKECRYQAAGDLFGSRMYAEARRIYAELGNYASSAEKKDECTYLLAEGYQKSGEYDRAIAEYETIPEYKDAAAKWSECHQAIAENEVKNAETLLRSGKTDQAIEAYRTAYGEYLLINNPEKTDSLALMIAECYQSGNKLNDAVEWFMLARKHADTLPKLESIAAYCMLTEQKESEEYVLQAIFWAKAENALDAGDYKTAVEYYDQINNESINKAREEEANYYYGAALLTAGEYEKAIEEFTKAGAYSDAADKIKESWLDYGNELLTGGEYQEAREAYAKAGEDDKITEAWNLEAENYLAEAQFEDARNAFEKAGNTARYEDTVFEEANALMNDGQFKQAYKLFASIKKREGVWEILAAHPEFDIYMIKAGDVITFGRYEQDNNTSNGPEEIEWIVLDYDEVNHNVLLLSRYGLDAMTYNAKREDTTWEKCTLRAWLNGEFLSEAFSAAEQSAILTTAVDNSKSQGYGKWNTDGGSNTEDRIFLLSYAEANRYLNVTFDDSNNLKSRVAPTAYALAHGARINDKNKTEDGAAAGWWWLRSPGNFQYIAAIVPTDGSLSLTRVNNDNGVVRPAFWLNLESGIF